MVRLTTNTAVGFALAELRAKNFHHREEVLQLVRLNRLIHINHVLERRDTSSELLSCIHQLRKLDLDGYLSFD